MSLFFRSIAALAFIFLLSPVFASAADADPSPAGAARVIKVKPVFDAGALEPGKPVDVHVLITIEAPEIASVQKRVPVAVSMVIDRSTSMYDDKKIDYAKIAGKLLVNTLRNDDLLAITVYDSQVAVLQPLAEVRDKQKLIKLIDGITPQGTTFLSGGLEKGIEQLEKVRSEFPCRVLLLSDGMANRGITDPEEVSEIGAKSRKRGVNVSTIGLGLKFQEDLMQYLAQRGGGQYYYIKDSEDLPGVFKQELNLVLHSFTKNLQARYAKPEGVEEVSVYGYTSKAKGNDLDIDLGDLSAGEKRQIMLRVRVKPAPSSGMQKLGSLTFNYTDPESSQARSLSVPMELDVLADEGARKALEKKHEADIGRVKDEVLILEADAAHVKAINELQKGNVQRARTILKEQEAKLVHAAPGNIVAQNKLAQIQRDEKQFEEARRSPAVMMGISKKSKASAYKSAQGDKQGLMLMLGDRGYQVEKLQRALKTAGFWDKDIDGVYSQDVVDAVRAFQKSKSLSSDGVAGESTQKALGM